MVDDIRGLPAVLILISWALERFQIVRVFPYPWVAVWLLLRLFLFPQISPRVASVYYLVSMDLLGALSVIVVEPITRWQILCGFPGRNISRWLLKFGSREKLLSMLLEVFSFNHLVLLGYFVPHVFEVGGEAVGDSFLSLTWVWAWIWVALDYQRIFQVILTALPVERRVGPLFRLRLACSILSLFPQEPVLSVLSEIRSSDDWHLFPINLRQNHSAMLVS
jgi:hypothetical protein